MLKRLGISMIFLQLTRLLFYLFNFNFFKLEIFDFIISIWFDVITISLFFSPFIFFSLLPFSFRDSKIYQRFLKFIFHIVNSLLIALNLVDVVYFAYTNKRSTIDLMSFLVTGNDFYQLIGSLFSDFWLMFLFFVVFLLSSIWIYNKIKQEAISKHKDSMSYHLTNSFVFVFCCGITLFLARGGFTFKPISSIEASLYTKTENTAFVLNTPFTMLKSIGKNELDEKKYFSFEKEVSLFNPRKFSVPKKILPSQTNVCIIILESFGNEWIGVSKTNESFSPFLDSLAKESLYFKNGISNGKKSIEAIPAILASIPSLMNTPYISSAYANNTLNALPKIVKENGYSTAFFHGATNGSMRFDAFAKQSGFDYYYGRTEYGNDEHFDKNWGILDEYFNPWVAEKLSDLKQPFLGTLFTLSSHHPYFIPPHMRGKLKKGPHPICESIHYADYSLKLFFEKAKKQDWYKNTLFVICADHSPATSSSIYSQRTEIYKIPILFYHPKKLIEPKLEEQIFQQLDIMPTILDLLNLKVNYFAYGNSYYQNENPEAITYLEGTYHYFYDKFMLSFSGDKSRTLYNHSVTSEFATDSLLYYPSEAFEMEQRLKAIIQNYNRSLKKNETF
jgi:phosphoglycerol transferase MdoB-like AlkP superfamily enzyme